MVKMYKNLKLGKKVFLGYAFILVLLLCSFLFQLVNQNHFQQNFEKYGKISDEQMLAGRIQANLLESRIAYENFILFGDEAQKTIFEERYHNMDGFIQELSSGLVDSERVKEIGFIQDSSAEYKADFNKIVNLEGGIDENYELLQEIGTDLEEDLTSIVNETYEANHMELSHKSGLVLKELLKARLYVTKYLDNNDDKYISEASTSLNEMNQHLKVVTELVNSSALTEEIQLFTKNENTYWKLFGDTIELIKERNAIVEDLKIIGPQISQHAENIKLSIIDEQKTYKPMIQEEIGKSISLSIGVAFFGFVIAIFISIKMTNAIVKPVKTVTNTFKEISEGEANLQVRLKTDSLDELGEMSNFFNHFMGKLQIIVTQNRNQSWIKSGQTELNEVIQSSTDLVGMGKNIIHYITRYINAQMGVLYLRSESGEYSVLNSYAYPMAEAVQVIQPGEGLIGQAALDKDMKVIDHLPANYISIKSGLGEGRPENVVIVPCLLNGEVRCIFEVSSFQKMTEIQLEFLSLIRETIAISLHAMEAGIKLNELLEKTITQSEELQMQQEELRQSNEELEDHTRALKESEERLQMQKEELRVTNDELLERTRLLEIQKNDISQKNGHLIKAREEIEEKATALEKVSKYKSEFLANMSHELRTPLNSILVLSGLLAAKKDQDPLTAKQLEFASTIHSAGNDLLKLINDILDMSKVEAGKLTINKEQVNLVEICNWVERVFQQIGNNKGLDFKIEIDDSLPDSILTDPMRLQQILNNLLSNAFKFTEKGSVSLKLSRMEKDLSKDNDLLSDKDITVEQVIAITVTDTGIGVPESKLQEIFEAFKQSDGTTSRKYGGTGLGLYITKELTQLLGGSILLESTEGKGSSFTIILPLDAQSIDKVEEKTANSKGFKKTIQSVGAIDEHSGQDNGMLYMSDGDKKLLIIEDDLNFSHILSDLAKQKGYQCILADNGETGIRTANDSKPDAIILDIGLPDLDGWKVAEVLKSNPETKDIPIHIISGNEMEKEEDFKNGIIGYLQKPLNLYKIEEIFSKFQQVISHTFKRVLMVDGDLDHTKKAIEVLTSNSIEVNVVPTGKMAFHEIRDKNYDCIILDLKLKDMSGFEFLAKLREKQSYQIPVIINTDHELTKEEEANLKKHAECIIIKGARSIDRLVDEVNSFLHELIVNQENQDEDIDQRNDVTEKYLRNKKVLIVDDDMRNVFALTSILEHHGMRVIVGRNGRDGVTKLFNNSDIDLILMDIMMPEMDGYTAMKEIRKSGKYDKLPIIAITAKAMKEDRNKCIEAGANEYLTKPIDTLKLISILKVWLHK